MKKFVELRIAEFFSFEEDAKDEDTFLKLPLVIVREGGVEKRHNAVAKDGMSFLVESTREVFERPAPWS